MSSSAAASAASPCAINACMARCRPACTAASSGACFGNARYSGIAEVASVEQVAGLQRRVGVLARFADAVRRRCRSPAGARSAFRQIASSPLTVTMPSRACASARGLVLARRILRIARATRQQQDEDGDPDRLRANLAPAVTWPPDYAIDPDPGMARSQCAAPRNAAHLPLPTAAVRLRVRHPTSIARAPLDHRPRGPHRPHRTTPAAHRPRYRIHPRTHLLAATGAGADRARRRARRRVATTTSCWSTRWRPA